MALLKFSALVAEARGKLNGVVLARNQYGPYVRTKTTPANPATAYQVAVRSYLADASSTWRTLSEDQRSAWEWAARNATRRNIFGDSAPLSGFNHFVKLYCRALNLGATPLEDAPPFAACESLQSVAVNSFSASPGFDMLVSPTTVPVGHTAVLTAAINLSPGRTYVNSQYRVVVVLPAEEELQADYGTQLVTRLGAITEGQRGFFRLQFFNNTSFQTSPPLHATAIAQA